MIEIIEAKDKWDTVLQNMDVVDFYHTHEYHRLDKNKEEKAILFNYTEGSRTIALPLLIRKIPGTNYNDATSVYGYPGPLTKGLDNTFDNTEYKRALQQIFKEKNIVSAFSRLNPFIPNQELCFDKLGKTITLGNVVNIDLCKDLESQRQEYHRRLKTYINKSKRYCTVKVENNQDGLEQFINLYYETMLRLNARPRYFFTQEYFYNLLKSKTFKVDILIAYNDENGEAIAAAMFVTRNNIVQYHLSGSKLEYHNLSPIKLLIDEMRIRATKENCSYLNLGGGLGNKEDSLFHFKNGFSKDLKPFKVWKYICDEGMYQNLVKMKEKNLHRPFHKRKEHSSYFPNYRCEL